MAAAMSLVTTPEERPKSEALARAIASSRSRTGMIGASGPNDSSRTISASRGTLAMIVGSSCAPLRLPPSSTSAPAATALATLSSSTIAAGSSMTVPMRVASSAGSPTVNSAALATNLSVNSSSTGSSTRMRLTAVQRWPELRNDPSVASVAARSRSASLSTMSGALPPSSRQSFL